MTVTIPLLVVSIVIEWLPGLAKSRIKAEDTLPVA
jgi:hypothetical protein